MQMPGRDYQEVTCASAITSAFTTAPASTGSPRRRPRCRAATGCPCWWGVYLLALRHPLLTARQLASISQLAPGRLVLGAGVGGEDRSEVSNSGVAPASRGRRLDECLQVLRALASGDAVDHQGS